MEANTPVAQSPPAPSAEHPGFTANHLKLIAIIAMLIDHIAWAFVPMSSVAGIVMHMIGRITGPTMFYFLAEGYRYTKHQNMYTLRLGIFALISWLPFYYFRFGTLPSLQSFSPVGVIYTLFLAHLAIRARHEVKDETLRALAIIVIIGFSSIGDWSIIGVIIALVFDIYYGKFNQQAIAYSCIVLFSIIGPLITLLSMHLSGVNHDLVYEMVATTIIQLGLFIPLILVYFYNGKLGGGGSALKWFFYIIYPTHLLILGILRFVIFV